MIRNEAKEILNCYKVQVCWEALAGPPLQHCPDANATQGRALGAARSQAEPAEPWDEAIIRPFPAGPRRAPGPARNSSPA
jgi:hypothetical protein